MIRSLHLAIPKPTDLRDYGLLIVGAVVQAAAMVLFFIPGLIASGGISGLAQIINYRTGLPIGVMVMAMNVPVFVLGWRHLGGRRFFVRTVFTVALYSLALDLGQRVVATGPTRDPMLNALYGGVVGGIGMGITFLGQGTNGGTDIIARVMARMRGIPLAQSYLFSDALVVVLGGSTFGWERALYAILALYIAGVAAEVMTEGANVVRTAVIVSDRSREVADAILREMERGVTGLHGEGMYTRTDRTVLYVVVSRSEVQQLKSIIYEIDPQAFVVIGQASEALGEGFRPLKD